MGLMKMVDTVWVNTYILDAELEKLIMILKRILYDYITNMYFFPWNQWVRTWTDASATVLLIGFHITSLVSFFQSDVQ